MKRGRAAGIVAVAVWCAASLAARAGEDSSPVRRSAPRTLYVQVEMLTRQTRETGGTSFFTGILPLPQSNGYQDVTRLWHTEGGSVLRYEENEWEYLAIYGKTRNRTLSMDGPTPELAHRFRVDLYDVDLDRGAIGAIYPQAINKYPYPQYTREYKPYIMPNHRTIRRIARKIRVDRKLREDNQLDFAYAAFRHVTEHFRLVPQKEVNGLSRLDAVLEKGEGNSCDLSGVFVSILRSAGIPARHLAGMRIDGTPHVLAEFYLNRYGWIPVDVAMQMERGGEEAVYFGGMRAADGIVVLSCDLGLTVSPPNERREKVPLLQQYLRWPKPVGGDPDGVPYRFRTLTREDTEERTEELLLM